MSINSTPYLSLPRWQTLAALSLLVIITSYLSGCSTIISASRDEPISENYGKRTTGARIDDQLIETKASVNLRKTDERFQKAQIDIDAHNGVVLLTGNVLQADMRDLATLTVQKIRKVRRVHNELEVSPPQSFGAKLGDSWLATKINTRFLFNKEVSSQRVHVVVENGVVFLMGLATRAEADRIVEVAKQTYGVQKIVRVFEYID